MFLKQKNSREVNRRMAYRTGKAFARFYKR
jgi:hypothetical protein